MQKTLTVFAVGLIASAALAAPPRVAVGYLVDPAKAGPGQTDPTPAAPQTLTPAQTVPWDRLTHVCHAFLQLDEQGEPVPSATVPSRTLAETAHRSGVRILLTVGAGETLRGLEAVSADPAKTTKLAQALAQRAVAAGYDGIDLVWESPRSAATRDGFTRVLAALRAALNAASSGRAEPLLLTAQVSPNPFFTEWIDAERAAPLVDWLHVATYNMCGPFDRTAAHHAPLAPSPTDPERAWRSVSGAMDAWHTGRGVPKEKLVMGLPLYGRAYPVASAYSPLDPALRTQHGELSYSRILSLLNQKWTAEWDKPASAPWLKTPDQKKLIVAYDDRNSVHLKATWARRQGYRGMHFWALNQDKAPDGRPWLVDAATRAWPE